MANVPYWTYQRLTSLTELQLEQLGRKAVAMTGHQGKEMLHNWAIGIFMSWSTVTEGFATAADSERLYALAMAVGVTD